MSKKRRPESDQGRSERLEQEALSRIENSAAEERSLDAASGGASSFTGHNRLGRNVMPSSGSSKDRTFTVFRTAAEEVQLKQDEHAWDNEGGHMSSTGGHVMRRPEAELPYVVTLIHHLSETTEHSFAS